MKKKGNSVLYFFGSVAMILAAVALTGLINFSKPNTTTTDLRAKASTNTLQLTANVVSTDESANTIVVQNVQLAPNSRSGPAKDLGIWTITPPQTFNLSQAFAGAQLTITISAQTFDINSRAIAATDIKITK